MAVLTERMAGRSRYWKETGDLSVWRGIAQDSVVMNTDDLLCIGCVDDILLSSTIGERLPPPQSIHRTAAYRRVCMRLCQVATSRRSPARC